MTAPPLPGTLVAPFTLALPTRIRFGAGSRHATGATAAAYGRRAMLVTGSSFASRPHALEVEASLQAAGVTVAGRVRATGEPDADAVLELAALLVETDADVVVAVGGGSVLDLAKAAAHRPDAARLAELLGGTRLEAPGVPVITLPTTAGSGAEVSHGAIVLDRAAGRKRGVRGPGVASREALVDPELMAGAPSAVAARAGFDAIAHAIETTASRAAGALAMDLAAAALPLLLDAVPRVVAAPHDDTAWGPAAYAAMLMGLNLASSTTCLPHRLQYPVGAATGTAHALGVAALMPAWLDRTARLAPGALAPLARRARLAPPDAPDEPAARSLEAVLLAHLDRTGLRIGLRDLGVTAALLPDLVGAVEGTLANDPGPVEPADLHALYAASL